MLKRNIFLKVLILLLIFSISSCKFQKTLRNGTPEEKYAAALSYYKKEDYYRASVLLDEVIPGFAGTADYEPAQFKFAYCQYHQNQLLLSAYYFERFYQTFGRSERAEEALYMHAVSLYEATAPHNLDQTTTFDAINALQNFLNTFRNSEYKPECEEMIKELREILEEKAFEQANLYAKLDNFKSAVVAFENFQNDFPDSEYNEEVAYLKLFNQYQLAKKSTERRKKERFEKAIDYCLEFIDKYEESSYLKDSQNIYDNCLDELSRIRNNNNF